MEDHVVCVVCGKKIFASDETCCFHDDGCPMHDLETAVADREIEAAIIRLMDFADCRCDNPCHPDCCPVCNPPAAQEPASQNADA